MGVLLCNILVQIAHPCNGEVGRRRTYPAESDFTFFISFHIEALGEFKVITNNFRFSDSVYMSISRVRMKTPYFVQKLFDVKLLTYDSDVISSFVNRYNNKFRMKFG